MGLGSETVGSNVTHEDNVQTTNTPLTPRPNTHEEVSQRSNLPEPSLATSPSGSDMGIPKSPEKRALFAVLDDAADEGYDTDGEIGPFCDGVEDEGPLEGMPEEEVGGQLLFEDNIPAAVEMNVGDQNLENTNNVPPALTIEMVNT